MIRIYLNNKITNVPNIGPCPECGASWDAGRVYDVLRKSLDPATYSDEKIAEMAAHYGGQDVHFSRVLAQEIPGYYDGVARYACPDCKKQWDRVLVSL